MRQNITLEQLKEIKSEMLVPLIKQGVLSKKGHHLIMLPYMAKQLTIGKMIEILDSITDDIEIMSDYQRDEKQDKYKCFWVEFENEGIKRFFIEKELCDALWQAVKEVL